MAITTPLRISITNPSDTLMHLRMRQIGLIAVSGFCRAKDTYPYLRGIWLERFKYLATPFDCVSFGRRMVTAEEAHTLSWAAAMGLAEIANLLLRRGDVNPGLMDNDGRTPFFWAD